MKKIFLLALCCIVKFAIAQQPDILKQKAITLKRLLEEKHYQPLIWNDSASIRLYNKWLDLLDEEKLFFTTADIATLEPYKHKLDEEMNGGNWQFFNASTSLFRRRIARADSIIKVVLDKPIDLAVNESLAFPFKTFAATDAALIERWRKYCKWQVLRKIADNNDSTVLSATALATELKKAVDAQKAQEAKYIDGLLGSSDAIFIKDLQEDYLNSIAWCYDPHSNYMNLSIKDAFDTEMSASEYSVGFDIKENEKGEAEVSFLQPGGSAWRNGLLHKGDVLIAVKVGKEFRNLAELSDEEIENAFGGTASAETELKVRTVTGETKIVKLKKEKVSSEEEVVKSYVLQGKENIGYIKLPGFYSREDESRDDISYDGCANDVSKEIVKLKKDSITGLILDLRYNGGGSMWEAIQLAGIFIDIGPVASLKERDGKTMMLKDPNRGSIYDGPLMVLINGRSASASEFLSAALQDYNRAIIVGGTTYGKGTAQSVLPLDTLEPNPNKKYEDFVKVTERKFYRINGSTAQWKGVEPDIALPDIYTGDAFKEKAEISALKPDMTKVAMYKPLPVLPLVDLKTKSAQRIAGNPYFKTILKLNELYNQNKNGRTVSLAWNSYLQQYKQIMTLVKIADAEEDEEAIKPKGELDVRNNSFDKQRIIHAGEFSKEVNEAYINNISNDPVVMEARAIMIDWNDKK